MAAPQAPKAPPASRPFEGKRFYVQMDPRLEEAPEFAGQTSATVEVQSLIELHGGTCTADLQEADLFVLQHRRQPECEEARRLFRPAVGLLWVLTCITTGQLVPATSQKHYKPFPLRAVTTRSAHAASLSGFKDVERNAVRLLLRCMGVEFMKGMKLALGVVLVAHDVGEDSGKIHAARDSGGKVAVVNSLWVIDCLVEGRLLPTAEYDRPGTLMDTLKALAEQEAASGSGGGSDSLLEDVPDSEEAAPAQAAAAAHQAALAVAAGAAATEAAAEAEKAQAAEAQAVDAAAVAALRASGSAPQVVSETVLTAGGWQQQMTPVAEGAEDAAADVNSAQPVGAPRHSGEEAVLPQQDGASDEELEEPEPGQDVGSQQAAAGQRSNSSSGPRVPDLGRLGVTQAMDRVGGFVADLGTEEPVFAPEGSDDEAAEQDVGGQPAAAAATTDADEFYTARPDASRQEPTQERLAGSAAAGAPLPPASPAASEDSGEATPDEDELSQPRPGSGGAVLAEDAAASGPSGGWQPPPQAVVEQAAGPAANAALEATAPFEALEEGSETEAEGSPPPQQRPLQGEAVGAGAEGSAAPAVEAEVQAATSPATTEPFESSPNHAGGPTGPVDVEDHSPPAAAQLPTAAGAVPAGSGLAASPALHNQQEAEARLGQPQLQQQDGGAPRRSITSEMGGAAAAEDEAVEDGEMAKAVPVAEEGPAEEAALVRPGAAKEAAGPASEARAAAVPSDASPPVPPPEAAAKAVATAALERRTTRSRSRSATPASGGSAGRKRKQAAPERAMFSQQLAEPDEHELRSLRKLQQRESKAAATGAAAATAAAASAKKAATARAARAGRNSDGVEMAPLLRRPSRPPTAQKPGQPRRAEAGSPEVVLEAGAAAEQDAEQPERATDVEMAEAPTAQLAQQEEEAGPARKRSRASGKRKAAGAAAAPTAQEPQQEQVEAAAAASSPQGQRASGRWRSVIPRQQEQQQEQEPVQAEDARAEEQPAKARRGRRTAAAASKAAAAAVADKPPVGEAVDEAQPAGRAGRRPTHKAAAADHPTAAAIEAEAKPRGRGARTAAAAIGEAETEAAEHTAAQQAPRLSTAAERRARRLTGSAQPAAAEDGKAKTVPAAVEQQEQPEQKPAGRRASRRSAGRGGQAAQEEGLEAADAAAMEGEEGDVEPMIVGQRASGRKRKAARQQDAAEQEEEETGLSKRRRTTGGKVAPTAGKAASTKKQPVATPKPAAKAAGGAQSRRRSAAPAAADAAGTAADARGRARKVVVALSGMHSDEQDDIAKTLRKLKVKCVTGNQRHDWSPDVTHVVSHAPRRNQKSLAALASGSWLLGPSWVDDCHAAGALVPEEGHELLGGSEDLDRGVARHWRRRAASTGGGAFQGLHMLVGPDLDKPFKREDIVNVIKAGGAQVVPLSRWHSAAAGGSRSGAGVPIDLVISKTASASSSPALAALVAQGSLAATPQYVVDWLAKPRTSLSTHVLLRSKPGPALAAAAAARSTVAAPAEEEESADTEPGSPVFD